MVRVQDRPECAQGRGERSNGRFPGGGDETIVGHELQCASVEPEASIERRFGLEKAPGSEESQGQRPEALNQGQGPRLRPLSRTEQTELVLRRVERHVDFVSDKQNGRSID